MKIFLLLIFCLSSYADIFDYDDRHEIIDAPVEVQKNATSVGALIRKENLIQKSNGDFSLKGLSLKDDLKFCEDEKFAHEKLIANCSGALISEDTFLTAAHCVDKTNKAACEDYAISFDYNSSTSYVSKKENTYFCKSVITYEADKNFMGRDIAIIKLDRKVIGRKPLRVRKDKPVLQEEIYMIGYPFGISQKYTENGQIEKDDHYRDSFIHHLDSFSVNSGSPIFSKDKNDIVGVLVRGTGMNYISDGHCNRWGVESFDDGFAIGNYLDFLFKD